MKIPKNWTFKSDEVAKGFDGHVRQTLPWYDMATGAVAHIAKHYIGERGTVYDIGASTGNIGKAIADVISDRDASLYAIEPSSQMQDLYSGGGTFVCESGEDFDYKEFDLAICFLTIMFMPVSKRDEFIKRLRSKCKKGGAIIVFDKAIPSGGYFSTILYRLTLLGKLQQGIKPDQIIEKEFSLSGIQRPIDPSILGPDAQLWFKYGDFCGWVIEADT